MPHRIDRILHAVCHEAWAVTPEYMATMRDVLAARVSGGNLDVPAFEARHGDLDRRGATAVIPLMGVISHRANMVSEFSGGTSIDSVRAMFRKAEGDPDVGHIVFDVDSPGGAVGGLPEFASEIRAAQTPVTAVANDLMASAAYFIASAADEIVATPSAMVGSIGTVTVHDDVSSMQESVGVKTTMISAGKGKTNANPFEPLSDAARDELQGMVDGFYAQFVDAVVKGRNAAGQHITKATVRDTFQAKIFLADQALANGMIDRVESLDQTIARVSGRGARRRTRAEVDTDRARAARAARAAHVILGA